MQRVGSRGVTADVARSLAVQLTPTLLSPSCLAATLQLALDAQDADGDTRDTALQLLDAVSHAAPNLFVNAGGQVCQSRSCVVSRLYSISSSAMACASRCQCWHASCSHIESVDNKFASETFAPAHGLLACM